VKIVPFEWRRWLDIRSFFRTRRALRQGRYHILHIQSGQLNAFGKMMGRLAGIPVIVMTEHVPAEDHIWIKNRAAIFIHLLLHRLSNAMADRIITVSDSCRASFIKRQGMAPEKVVTIYNGVDIKELKNRAPNGAVIKRELAISENDVVVGAVGRISPEKGYDTFITAARQVLGRADNVKFLMVGEGPDRGRAESLIDELGIKKYFILTGFREDVYDLMDIMNILVQPSLNEGFGLTVVEAMAKGKAVIASDTGCFKEIVKDGENGFVFPAGDSAKLAEKMQLLISDGDLRERLGASAQITAENHFDSGLMSEKTLKLYKEILLQKRLVACARE